MSTSGPQSQRLSDSTRDSCQRVLYADADEDARLAFSSLLREQGFIVDLAADGPEALALASQFPYAVVLTDVFLFGASGECISEEIQSACPLSTVVHVAGFDSESIAGTKSRHLVRKPWNEEELERIVRTGVKEYQSGVEHYSSVIEPPLSLCALRLLLVEDDPADAMLVERVLSKGYGNKYIVSQVGTLKEAVAALESEQVYEVVLADLTLPDSRGLDALTVLAPAAGHSPIIVLSGHTQEAMAFRSLKMGAHDYLVKGKFDGDSLHRAIRYSIERKRVDEELRYLAHHDQLTGLANRTLLMDRLTRALSHAQRRRELAGLMFIDLDRFKSVNDTLGHAAGDELLQEVSRRLVGSVRDTDTVARMGGDEFAIALEGVVEVEGVRRVAERILNAFATPIRLGDKSLVCSGSIGVAIFPNDASAVDELLKQADVAMYEAKKAGRSGYRFFNRASQATKP